MCVFILYPIKMSHVICKFACSKLKHIRFVVHANYNCLVAISHLIHFTALAVVRVIHTLMERILMSTTILCISFEVHKSSSSTSALIYSRALSVCQK